MFFREGSTGDGKDIGPELSLVSPKHNTSNHVSLRHGLIPDQLLRNTQPWVDGGGAEGDGGRGPLRGNLGCVLAKRTENGCWGESKGIDNGVTQRAASRSWLGHLRPLGREALCLEPRFHPLHQLWSITEPTI